MGGWLIRPCSNQAKIELTNQAVSIHESCPKPGTLPTSSASERSLIWEPLSARLNSAKFNLSKVSVECASFGFQYTRETVLSGQRAFTETKVSGQFSALEYLSLSTSFATADYPSLLKMHCFLPLPRPPGILASLGHLWHGSPCISLASSCCFLLGLHSLTPKLPFNTALAWA